MNFFFIYIIYQGPYGTYKLFYYNIYYNYYTYAYYYAYYYYPA